MKKRFNFGDKVHHWVWGKKYVVFKKTRGDYYIVLDKKGDFYKVGLLGLKKGWNCRQLSKKKEA